MNSLARATNSNRLSCGKFVFLFGTLIALAGALSNHAVLSASLQSSSSSSNRQRADGITDNGSSDSDMSAAESAEFLTDSSEPSETEMMRDEVDNESDGDSADEVESTRPASSNLVDNISTDIYGEPHVGLDTNIENAKIEISPNDMATAAGHHHSHHHYVHGKMYMGAESGKKGAFKWHSKHPVGGKGRR